MKIIPFLILNLLLFSITYAANQKKHKKQLGFPQKESAQSIPLSPDGRRRPILESAPEDLDEGSLSDNPTGNEPGKRGAPLLSEKDPCSEKHPIETFLQIPTSSLPAGGKSGGLFFLSDLRDINQVFYLESPGAWPTQITFFPDGVPYFKVSPDGEKIIVASHVGGDEQYDIYLYEVKSKKLIPLIVDRNKRIESVVWGPNSKWFVYTSTARNKKDFDLYQFDLGTQKQILLKELEGSNSITDVAPDGGSLLYTEFRSVTDSDVWTFDLKKKQATVLTPSPELQSAGNAFFTADSKHILLLSDASHGVHQVYVTTIQSPSSTRPLTSGKWGVEEITLNKERNRLVININEDGYSRFEGIEIDRAGTKKKTFLTPTLAKSVAKQATFSTAHGIESFFFAESSSQRPQEIWLWRNGNRKLWTQANHGLLTRDCFIKEKLIYYPSFDQLEIPAYVYLPKNFNPNSPAPVPFIVHVHGGPESQFRPGFNKLFQYLLERGFGIFAPNIRGSTGYGKEYTLKDNYKLRMDSVQDVVKGADWLTKNKYAKSKGLAIYGGSYGGFLVLRTIQVAPELFSAASESVGITNFVTFLKNTKPYRRALREIEYGPLSDEEFLKSVSPMTYLDKIKTPLMVFHGANDPRVPVSEAEQLIEALKNRDIPVDYTIFKDEGHGNAKLSNVMIQARSMAYFFEKHLRTDNLEQK